MRKLKYYYQSSGRFAKGLFFFWLFMMFIFIRTFIISYSEFGDVIVFLFIFAVLTSMFLIPAITMTEGRIARKLNPSMISSEKSWLKVLLLGVFFGFLGVHRFYTGRKKTGFLYLFTFGGAGIGWVTDLILIISDRFTDSKVQLISRKKQLVEKSLGIEIMNKPEISNMTHGNVSTTQGGIPTVAQTEISTSQEDVLIMTQDEIVDIPSVAVSARDTTTTIYTEITLAGEEECSETIPVPTAHRSFLKFSPRLKRETETDSHNTVETSSLNTQEEASEDLPDDDWSFYGNNGRSVFFHNMREYENKKGKECSFVPFSIYYPTYDSMNQRQKRWYFYWRSELRAGNLLQTDLSYIFIHVYELLSGYGWKNAEDGYQQLNRIWKEYRKDFPQLDNYMAGWCFDFSKKYNLAYKFPDWYDGVLPYQDAIRDMMIETYKDEHPLKLPFALIQVLSDYQIRNSKFYNNGNQLLMQEAIPRVIALVDAALFKKKKKGIFALYAPARLRKRQYYMFQGATCPDANKHMEISITGYCTGPKLRDFITTLVRYSENTLRDLYGARGRLRGVELDPELGTLINAFLKKEYTPKKEEPATPHVAIHLDPVAIRTLREQSDAVRDALEVAEIQETDAALLTDLALIKELWEQISSDAKLCLMEFSKKDWALSVSPERKGIVDEINACSVQCIARTLIVLESGNYILEDDYRDEFKHIINTIPQDTKNDKEDTKSEGQTIHTETIAPASDHAESSDKFFRYDGLSDALKEVLLVLPHNLQMALWTILAFEDPTDALQQIADEAFTMPELLIDEINNIAVQYLDDILIDTFDDVPYSITEQYKSELTNTLIKEEP